MIQVNKIESPTVELYNPDGSIINNNVNEYELLDVRCQIKRKELNGYYFIFNGQKVEIYNDGNLEFFPEGLYSISTNFLNELLGI